MGTLLQRAQQLETENVFLGGPIDVFETAGRKILMTLLSEELRPNSTVLDIGCGCLRGGYWLIHFLDEGGYCGIEPNVSMLEAGRRILLEPGLEQTKNPQYDHNSEFDFTPFAKRFDFYVARSIWTHASKAQIQAMLDGFVDTASDQAVFFTSYIKPTLRERDYKGSAWVGKSHESDEAGIVRHSFDWIQQECGKRGLRAEQVLDDAYNFGNQTWIKIKRD